MYYPVEVKVLRDFYGYINLNTILKRTILTIRHIKVQKYINLILMENY